MNFSAELPEVIRFGCGVRHELTQLLPAGNVLILCGRHSATELREKLLPQLENRAILIDEFPGEAPLDKLEAILPIVRGAEIQAIIGWGGGSAMDGAKALALVGSNPAGTIADYFYGRRKSVARQIFLACVPTTAGTGAEMTPNAVLCDHATGIKQSLRGGNLLPDVALVDPELLTGCPEAVLFASGFDALTQAIESTIARCADNLSRILAHESTMLLWNGLHRAAQGERTMEVFTALARGSMLAGAAFVRSGLGAVHGIGHPAGSKSALSHGVTCAVLLPTILTWNLSVARPALAETAARLGLTSPEKLIAEIQILRRQCQLPENFRNSALQASDIPFIVAHCRSGSMRSNPRDLSDAEVAEIVRSLL